MIRSDADTRHIVIILIDFCHIQNAATDATARAPAANLGRKARRCRAKAQAGPTLRPARPTPAARPALSCPRDPAGVLGRPFLQKRRPPSFSNRAPRGQHLALPPSGVQQSSRSHAPTGRSGRADGVGARCPGARDSRREGSEPHAPARRTRVARKIPRASPAHAAGGAQRARLRVEQFSQACTGRVRARSVLVSALVQWVGHFSRARRDAVAGRRGSRS
jgi:hypothetical protein